MTYKRGGWVADVIVLFGIAPGIAAVACDSCHPWQVKGTLHDDDHEGLCAQVGLHTDMYSTGGQVAGSPSTTQAFSAPDH